VLAATDADGAVAMARQTSPDVIVADLWLRGGSTGTDAAAAVCAATRKSVPLLIVTADTSGGKAPRPEGERNVVLYKPARPAQLRAALSHLLSGSP
jgi:CheY-like chemotaxis protein